MNLIKNLLTTTLALFVFAGAWAQISDTTTLVNQLPAEIEETSGLIFLNGKLWTHNDSGGEPILYSVDTTSGTITGRKTIAGVRNEDWEDIARDETHVYIGNFGSMSRHLQVLRIKIEDLENPDLDSIVPRIINFTYGTDGYPEEDFSATATRFDCEAMIVKDDTIFLFSKNWIDHKTYLYALPNKANFFHTITPIDSLALDYLITGADYNYATNTVALCGYTYNTASLDAYPHFTVLSNFEGNNFLSGTQTNKAMSGITNIGIQVEGITFRSPNRLWVSNEKATKSLLTIQPKLREFKLTGFPIVNEGQPQTYPEEPMPIKINFTISDSIVLTNQTIAFSDQSTMQPTEWHWDFGDGTTSSEQNPSHAYTSAGTYSITLNAKNESSDETKTIENIIRVYAPAVANFTVTDSTVSENHSITFHSTSENATSLAWTFDGGEPSTSNEENPMITYNEEGSFSVSLIASNPVSCDTITKENFIVVNQILDFNIIKASIYPNPAEELITISNPDDNFTFEIFDASGKLVMKSHKKTFAETTIDISFLKAGNYIMKVNSSNGKREIKFVKL